MLNNRVIRLSIFAVIAFFIQESWVWAEELTPSKEADIKRLLAITGVDDIGIQITNTFSRNIQQQAKSLRSDIPDSFFDEFYEELFILIDKKMTEPGSLTDDIIATYNKYYTHQEIKSLIEFYQTELGEKTLKLVPKIFQENLISSQQWVNKMGPMIWEFAKKKLKEKGFELPK